MGMRAAPCARNRSFVDVLCQSDTGGCADACPECFFYREGESSADLHSPGPYEPMFALEAVECQIEGKACRSHAVKERKEADARGLRSRRALYRQGGPRQVS